MAVTRCHTCDSEDLEYHESLTETLWCPTCLQFVHIEEDTWQVEPILWTSSPATDDPFGLECMNKIKRAA